MKLIIGLGNPGKKYENTRHNIGFMIADMIVHRHGFNDFKLDKKLESAITKSDSIIIAKPQTFMNESGRAVRKLMAYYKAKPEEVWVIYDDKDLPFANLRIRKKGSAGGHNGLKSVIEYLGTEDFPRFRCGILDPDKEIKDTAKYVLKKFSSKEKKALPEFTKRSADAVSFAIKNGVEQAMNEYNQ